MLLAKNRRGIPTGAWLFAWTWVVYGLCPPFTSYDSYWTVPTALRILQHGTTNVDPYIGAAPKPALDAAECVLPGRPARAFQPADGCAAGHWYNWFPIGVSIVSLPLIALLKLLVAATSPLVPHSGPFLISQVRSFFAGDFVAGHSLVELWTASFFGAAAVWLQYRIAARFLSRRWAVGLALLFAFGTSEWSIGSRSLLQHGLSVLLLNAALYLLLLGRRNPSLIPYCALPLGIAFTVRPTNALSIAAFTLYVASAYRKLLPRFLLWSLPAALPFFAYNLAVRHTLLPIYYQASPQIPFWPNILMIFISPSRGLFLFTPVALFSIAGIVFAFRCRWCVPLTAYLAAILVAHSLIVACWWPGHCYGPRYFTDVTPYLIFFLIPGILCWQNLAGFRRPLAAGLFIACAVWGVCVHARGATSLAAQAWSSTPISVDDAHHRVWDWSDPQFLRGL
jgi:hypothetical protein